LLLEHLWAMGVKIFNKPTFVLFLFGVSGFSVSVGSLDLFHRALAYKGGEFPNTW